MEDELARRRIADIRKQEFAVAAFEVLSLYGMQGTTLQRVAEHTGASKASVLHYFSTKQNLIETALRRANGTLQQEAVALMKMGTAPWDRFYGVIEANFSPTTFLPKVANGWISMCAEVPHNSQFQRLQTVIYRRLDSNLRSALLDTGASADAAKDGANIVSLLIDGLWLRCGLQIGGLAREDAIAQIETVITERFGQSDQRRAARDKMRMLAQAMTQGRPG
jgi:TetR/AcrR family transcriptional regulator, transcriptional repressor of bet genes